LAKHVLIVDDEKRIREVVEYALQKDGYRVSSVADGLEALAAVEQDPPDLVVLDVMLPGLDGLSVCRKIRSQRATPILFLSARADEVDRIVGLELGGDDYLVKPFSLRELVARVRAVLRRFEAAGETPEPEARPLCHGQLKLDLERHEATFSGQRVQLTATEFERFFTTDADRSGTGLGLAIVNSVVLAHAGTVSIESRLGQGTRFCVRLPARPA
jgi:two-component system OmpR family response regulator